MKRIAVLLPATSGPPTIPPADLPFGRAALSARAHGVDIVFGEAGSRSGELSGYRAVPDGWQAATIDAQAVFDRFRSQSFPGRYAELTARFADLPWGNHPAVIALCRDKWRSQHTLTSAGVPMPDAVDSDFEAAIAAWGEGFLKPRFGSFGRHVRHVTPTSALPSTGPGMTGRVEPNILQRAVPPPGKWRGVSVRALVQSWNGQWRSRTPVARRSSTEAVVNVARGAEVAPAAEMFGASTASALRETAIHAARAMDRAVEGLVLEVGVDLVVDPEDGVWVIEVNGRPRGRLQALRAYRRDYDDEHLDSCLHPLLELARRV